MSERWSHSTKAFAEALAPYGTETASGAHTKLSVSLPTDLVELVREAAAESGTSVSGMIAAAVRRALEDAEQARLDRALELDAEENLAWANAYLPIATKLWADLEW
jgi:uncharacterized protein (DUF1778 family)